MFALVTRGPPFLVFLAVVASSCVQGPTIDASGTLTLLLPDGETGVMDLGANLGSLPSDLRSVHDGDLTGTCTIRRSGLVDSLIQVHLERRLSARTDPCAAPGGFSDVVFSHTYPYPDSVVVRRCPVSLFADTADTTMLCSVGVSGLGDGVLLSFETCHLVGAEGDAVLDGTIELHKCEVVE